MVVFTCNHCGESLKKNTVEKHIFRCSKHVSVCCMDCLKDFDRDTFSSHTQCVTELERYSGKDYVPKANQNKGQKKQEAWVDLVRSITEKNNSLSQGIRNILDTISAHDNIPRKKQKFVNFMSNSFRYMKANELDQAWSLLEEAMKESKAAASKFNESKPKAIPPPTNGKRKLENESDEGFGNGSESEPLEKKQKNEPTEAFSEEKLSEATPEGKFNEKFRWGDTIRSILSAKDNELKLKKLKKKVMRRYQSLTGGEWSDKIENKFNKTVKKLKGVEVEDEKIRLIV